MRTNVSRSAPGVNGAACDAAEPVSDDQSPGGGATHATTSSGVGQYRATRDVIWLGEVATRDDFGDAPVSDVHFFFVTATTRASARMNCATIPRRTRHDDRPACRSSSRRATVRAGRTSDHPHDAALAADHGQPRSPPGAAPARRCCCDRASACRSTSERHSPLRDFGDGDAANADQPCLVSRPIVGVFVSPLFITSRARATAFPSGPAVARLRRVTTM